MWLRGIRSSSSLAGSWISALISCTAYRVDSVPPLIVIILSPFLSFCLSTSMCAPVTSWMAVMLQPPLPIIRDTTEAGTESFLDLRTTSFHPSSLFWVLFGLRGFILLLGEVTGSEMVLNEVGRELGVKSLIS